MAIKNALRTTVTYPLSRELKRLLQPKGAASPYSLSLPHTNVISPSLCDDVVSFLGPSLKEYQGCDVIDLHPGPCLWSTKLHDALRPRCHLLMEPEPVYYEPFIKPLLDAPDSRYKHTNLSGAHPRSYWAVYNDIFNDDLLPKRPAIEPDDPALRKPDRTLLITGALHRDYDVRRYRNNVDQTMLILNQMIHAGQLNSMFHCHGLVRMLFWLPEATRDQLYPTTLAERNSINLAIEAVADLTEVTAALRQSKTKTLTTGKPDRRTRQARVRADRIEACSTDMARDRMLSQNLTLPESRQSLGLRASLSRPISEPSELVANLAAAGPAASQLDSPTKIKTQIKEFATDVDIYVDKLAKHRPYRADNFSRTVERPRSSSSDLNYFAETRYKLPEESLQNLSDWLVVKHTPFAALNIRQVALEKALQRLDSWLHARTTNRPSHKALADSLMDTSQKLRQCINSLLGARSFAMRTMDMLEEERGLTSNPEAVVPRDRRPYDPLVVSPDEFWPQTPLYLFDIMPRSKNLASDINTAAEANTVMRDLAQTIMMRSREDIARALDRVGPNAARDLIDATPALKDAGEGGRLDLRDLTVRMVTRDMFLKLVESFLEWPFRPTTAELAVGMQDLHVGADDEDEHDHDREDEDEDGSFDDEDDDFDHDHDHDHDDQDHDDD